MAQDWWVNEHVEDKMVHTQYPNWYWINCSSYEIWNFIKNFIGNSYEISYEILLKTFTVSFHMKGSWKMSDEWAFSSLIHIGYLMSHITGQSKLLHGDVIKWKHFPRYWPFVWGIRRSPVNSHHKGQWRGGLIFSLICAWINAWVNNREADDLRRHRAHYDVTVMRSELPPLTRRDLVGRLRVRWWNLTTR